LRDREVEYVALLGARNPTTGREAAVMHGAKLCLLA
jgi:hypothetical protein